MNRPPLAADLSNRQSASGGGSLDITLFRAYTPNGGGTMAMEEGDHYYNSKGSNINGRVGGGGAAKASAGRQTPTNNTSRGGTSNGITTAGATALQSGRRLPSLFAPTAMTVTSSSTSGAPAVPSAMMGEASMMAVGAAFGQSSSALLLSNTANKQFDFKSQGHVKDILDKRSKVTRGVGMVDRLTEMPSLQLPPMRTNLPERGTIEAAAAATAKALALQQQQQQQYVPNSGGHGGGGGSQGSSPLSLQQSLRSGGGASFSPSASVLAPLNLSSTNMMNMTSGGGSNKATATSTTATASQQLQSQQSNTAGNTNFTLEHPKLFVSVQLAEDPFHTRLKQAIGVGAGKRLIRSTRERLAAEEVMGDQIMDLFNNNNKNRNGNTNKKRGVGGGGRRRSSVDDGGVSEADGADDGDDEGGGDHHTGARAKFTTSKVGGSTTAAKSNPNFNFVGSPRPVFRIEEQLFFTDKEKLILDERRHAETHYKDSHQSAAGAAAGGIPPPAKGQLYTRPANKYGAGGCVPTSSSSSETSEVSSATEEEGMDKLAAASVLLSPEERKNLKKHRKKKSTTKRGSTAAAAANSSSPSNKQHDDNEDSDAARRRVAKAERAALRAAAKRRWQQESVMSVLNPKKTERKRGLQRDVDVVKAMGSEAGSRQVAIQRRVVRQEQREHRKMFAAQLKASNHDVKTSRLGGLGRRHETLAATYTAGIGGGTLSRRNGGEDSVAASTSTAMPSFSRSALFRKKKTDVSANHGDIELTSTARVILPPIVGAQQRARTTRLLGSLLTPLVGTDVQQPDTTHHQHGAANNTDDDGVPLTSFFFTQPELIVTTPSAANNAPTPTTAAAAALRSAIISGGGSGEYNSASNAKGGERKNGGGGGANKRSLSPHSSMSAPPTIPPSSNPDATSGSKKRSSTVMAGGQQQPLPQSLRTVEANVMALAAARRHKAEEEALKRQGYGGRDPVGDLLSGGGGGHHRLHSGLGSVLCESESDISSVADDDDDGSAEGYSSDDTASYNGSDDEGDIAVGARGDRLPKASSKRRSKKGGNPLSMLSSSKGNTTNKKGPAKIAIPNWKSSITDKNTNGTSSAAINGGHRSVANSGSRSNSRANGSESLTTPRDQQLVLGLSTSRAGSPMPNSHYFQQQHQSGVIGSVGGAGNAMLATSGGYQRSPRVVSMLPMAGGHGDGPSDAEVVVSERATTSGAHLQMPQYGAIATTARGVLSSGGSSNTNSAGASPRLNIHTTTVTPTVSGGLPPRSSPNRHLSPNTRLGANNLGSRQQQQQQFTSNSNAGGGKDLLSLVSYSSANSSRRASPMGSPKLGSLQHSPNTNAHTWSGGLRVGGGVGGSSSNLLLGGRRQSLQSNSGLPTNGNGNANATTALSRGSSGWGLAHAHHGGSVYSNRTSGGGGGSDGALSRGGSQYVPGGSSAHLGIHRTHSHSKLSASVAAYCDEHDVSVEEALVLMAEERAAQEAERERMAMLVAQQQAEEQQRREHLDKFGPISSGEVFSSEAMEGYRLAVEHMRREERIRQALIARRLQGGPMPVGPSVLVGAYHLEQRYNKRTNNKQQQQQLSGASNGNSPQGQTSNNSRFLGAAANSTSFRSRKGSNTNASSGGFLSPGNRSTSFRSNSSLQLAVSSPARSDVSGGEESKKDGIDNPNNNLPRTSSGHSFANSSVSALNSSRSVANHTNSSNSKSNATATKKGAGFNADPADGELHPNLNSTQTPSSQHHQNVVRVVSPPIADGNSKAGSSSPPLQQRRKTSASVVAVSSVDPLSVSALHSSFATSLGGGDGESGTKAKQRKNGNDGGDGDDDDDEAERDRILQEAQDEATRRALDRIKRYREEAGRVIDADEATVAFEKQKVRRYAKRVAQLHSQRNKLEDLSVDFQRKEAMRQTEFQRKREAMYSGPVPNYRAVTPNRVWRKINKTLRSEQDRLLAAETHQHTVDVATPILTFLHQHYRHPIALQISERAQRAVDDGSIDRRTKGKVPYSEPLQSNGGSSSKKDGSGGGGDDNGSTPSAAAATTSAVTAAALGVLPVLTTTDPSGHQTTKVAAMLTHVRNYPKSSPQRLFVDELFSLASPTDVLCDDVVSVLVYTAMLFSVTRDEVSLLLQDKAHALVMNHVRPLKQAMEVLD